MSSDTISLSAQVNKLNLGEETVSCRFDVEVKWISSVLIS